MGEKLEDSLFGLWHANAAARKNLRDGYSWYDAGHYLINGHADDIDWQIECDFLGAMYPGLVNEAAMRAYEIGLLWGEGDFAKTVEISCRCGQDSDCNPSSAASILGNYYGASGINAIYKSQVDYDTTLFSETVYTLNQVVDINMDLTKEVMTAYGASEKDGVWTYKTNKSLEPVPYEQWEDDFGAGVILRQLPNGMVQVVAGSTGKEALQSMEIDMGDGFTMYSGGCYSYKKKGTYTLKYTFVSDKGTIVTGEKTVKIEAIPTGKGISSSGDGTYIFDGTTPYSAVAGAAKIQLEVKPSSPDADVWAGIQFDKAFAINGLKFVEGKQNKKGGWFTETPKVEVLIDGVWTAIESEIFPAYPGNSVEAQGDAFQQYRFAFDEVLCDGVRIIGKAGGTDPYISIGELTPRYHDVSVSYEFDNASTPIAICNLTAPTDLFIGAMGEKIGQRQFLGKLDDIQIYNCALSEAYIQNFSEGQKNVLLDTKAEIGEAFTVTDADPDGFFAGEGFTLSVKFNRTADSKPGDIVKKNAGKGTYGFSVDDQKRLVMHVGESKYYADAPLGNGEYHAVMIQNPDSRTILFYLNGVLQGATKPANQSVPSLSRDLVGEGAINVNGANVQIKECKLYDYAVNENVILAGYKTADAMGRDIFVYDNGETEFHLPYRVYFPSGYDPESAEKYPMLFFLHGHGETGMDNVQNIRVNGGQNKLINDLIAKDNIIIVAPQVTCDDGGDREWFNSNAHKWAQGSRPALPENPTLAMSAAMALLDEYLAGGKVDTSRVYAAGISMGGYGTWELITRRSEVFAAAIPLCGAGIPSEAAKLTNIAIWAFHGTADTTVPPKGTSDMEAAIKAAGGKKMKATYIAGVGHSCWDQAYATSGLVDWLLAQSK